MLIFLDLRTLKLDLFSEAVDNHGENEAHQRPESDLVARRNDKVERYGPFVINQLVDAEIAPRGIPGDQGIAIQREGRFGGREHPREIAILLIEHLLNFLANYRVGDRSLPCRHVPAVLTLRIVRIIQ